MKKLVCSLLIGASAICLTACGNSTTSEESNSNDKSSVTSENPSGSIEVGEDGYVHVNDLTGKTLGDLLDNGYDYSGYMSVDSECYVYISSEEIDDATIEIIKQLEGLTVQDLLDKDVDISYMSINDVYSYSTSLGSITVSFDIDGGAEVMKQYEDVDFADIEDMVELHDKAISNVSFNYVDYTVILDNAVNELDIDLFDAEEQLKDFSVVDCYYEPIPDDF